MNEMQKPSDRLAFSEERGGVLEMQKRDSVIMVKKSVTRKECNAYNDFRKPFQSSRRIVLGFRNISRCFGFASSLARKRMISKSANCTCN